MNREGTAVIEVQDQLYAVIGAIILAFIPAFIAYKRGRNRVPYFALSFLVTPIGSGILAAICRRDLKVLEEREDRQHARRGEIRCPACREFMRSGATVCPHCSTLFPPCSGPQSEVAPPGAQARQEPEKQEEPPTGAK